MRRKQTRRRLFLFNLAMLAVEGAAVAGWLRWELHLVQERARMREWIVVHGGSAKPLAGWVTPLGSQSPTCRVAAWRAWLGDEPIVRIELAYDADEQTVRRTERLFPEAEVSARPRGHGMGIF